MGSIPISAIKTIFSYYLTYRVDSKYLHLRVFYIDKRISHVKIYQIRFEAMLHVFKSLKLYSTIIFFIISTVVLGIYVPEPKTRHLSCKEAT